MLTMSIPWIIKVGGNESPVLRIPNGLVQSIIPTSCALAICYAGFLILLEMLGINDKESEDDNKKENSEQKNKKANGKMEEIIC